MLQNASILAIVAVHTDENEPSRVQLRNNKLWFRPQSECFNDRKETPFRAANHDGRERSWGLNSLLWALELGSLAGSNFPGLQMKNESETFSTPTALPKHDRNHNHMLRDDHDWSCMITHENIRRPARESRDFTTSKQGDRRGSYWCCISPLSFTPFGKGSSQSGR